MERFGRGVTLIYLIRCCDLRRGEVCVHNNNNNDHCETRCTEESRAELRDWAGLGCSLFGAWSTVVRGVGESSGGVVWADRIFLVWILDLERSTALLRGGEGRKERAS